MRTGPGWNSEVFSLTEATFIDGDAPRTTRNLRSGEPLHGPGERPSQPGRGASLLTISARGPILA
jgi:hypothetical protein